MEEEFVIRAGQHVLHVLSPLFAHLSELAKRIEKKPLS